MGHFCFNDSAFLLKMANISVAIRPVKYKVIIVVKKRALALLYVMAARIKDDNLIKTLIF